MALVSRLSIENNILKDPTQWHKCKRRKFRWISIYFKVFDFFRHELCWGLMQIPASQSPNVNAAGDSVDHFLEGINELIALTTQMSGNFKSFSPSELTRAGLAAYDVGISSIQSRGFYFKQFWYFDKLLRPNRRVNNQRRLFGRHTFASQANTISWYSLKPLARTMARTMDPSSMNLNALSFESQKLLCYEHSVSSKLLCQILSPY